MSDIDRSSVFERTHAEQGANESEIRAMLETALAPLTLEEINEINAAHPKPWGDPREWVIPDRPFPESYLSFLRWSNGGSFFNGERKFDGFFPADKIREYLLCYWIPMKMAGTVLISFDGGGGHPTRPGRRRRLLRSGHRLQTQGRPRQGRSRLRQGQGTWVRAGMIGLGE